MMDVHPNDIGLGEDNSNTIEALYALFAPIAELCVAKAIPIQSLEVVLRQAFVNAAKNACLEQTGKNDRITSRVSTMTGLTRREVDRLLQMSAQSLPQKITPPIEVFNKWLASRHYQEDGKPKILARKGSDELNFDALVRSVTKDINPRSILDEMCRLKLTHWDTAADTVSIMQNTYVPSNWQDLMLYVGHNVGDHLQAAVANVLDLGQHFEQAIYADDLDDTGLLTAQQLVAAEWQSMLTNIAPKLDALALSNLPDNGIQKHIPTGNKAIRIGLYAYSQGIGIGEQLTKTPDPHTNQAATTQANDGDQHETK